MAPHEAMTALLAAYDAVADCDLESLPAPGVLEFIDGLEVLTCQLPTQSHRALARLQVETTPQKLGAKSWKDVLATRWRITTSEAHRRLDAAGELGPRHALTGQPLPPRQPAVAAAQAGGLINAEHVKVLRDTLKALPGWVDTTTREQIEIDLVRVAVRVGPKELKDTAALRLFLLDQDGPEPDDTERARSRGLSKGPQRRTGNIPIRGELTPEAWATLEAIFAKFAAPGMCNPERPRAVRVRDPQPGPDRQRPPHPGPTPTRRAARGRADRVDEQPRRPQRTTGVDHHPHHPPRPRIPGRGRHHRRRHGPTDRRRHPDGRPRQPLPGRVRRCHRPSAGPVPHPTHRLASPAHHARRPRRRLHQTRLHRRHLRLPGPPRHHRLGPRRQHQHQRHGAGLPTRQPIRRPPRLHHLHERPPRSRMDPPTPPRHRPSTHQLLPPPRSPTPPTRRRPTTPTQQHRPRTRHRPPLSTPPPPTSRATNPTSTSPTTGATRTHPTTTIRNPAPPTPPTPPLCPSRATNPTSTSPTTGANRRAVRAVRRRRP